MTADWVAGEAEAFWDLAGGAPPFPRDLEACVPLALPLAVVPLPALSIGRIEGWLERRGSPFLIAGADLGQRRLRGCLIAYRGSGLLFVDGADLEAERRFTLAHEAAHFLLDYLRPRLAAIAGLGDGIVEVLDGQRPPTPAERIDAVLTSCPLGVHVHLLRRDDQDVRHTFVEDRADQLACELLAPAAEVERRFRVATPDAATLARAIQDAFGLPAAPAAAYAHRLARSWQPAPTFVEWLRS